MELDLERIAAAMRSGGEKAAESNAAAAEELRALTYGPVLLDDRDAIIQSQRQIIQRLVARIERGPKSEKHLFRLQLAAAGAVAAFANLEHEGYHSAYSDQAKYARSDLLTALKLIEEDGDATDQG